MRNDPRYLMLAYGIAQYPEAIRAHLLTCVLPEIEAYEVAEREYHDGFLIVWVDPLELAGDHPERQPLDLLESEIVAVVDELAAVDIDGEL